LPDRRSVAYHEAVHAFFFELYGFGSKQVAIEDEV
jgi:hypothetical protein